MRTSVLSLVRGRERHLANMLRGLAGQRQKPDEVIVALMQDHRPELPDELIEGVRFVRVEGDRLPLAKARNAAARVATGDLLIFLDVDCVPGPDLVSEASAAYGNDRVLMADTRYLGPGADASASFGDLWEASERHPARLDGEAHEEPVALGDMTELWSLAFALPADLYRRAGGFDESFVGYGAEDTDFALSLDRAGGELFFVPRMRAVHQWHEVRKPPLHHFGDIVENAERFRAKHGHWCMDYWLGQLRDDGFISWTDDSIEVLREPSADDLEASRQPSSVRFS